MAGLDIQEQQSCILANWHWQSGSFADLASHSRFTRAVEGLLRISDYHRREQLQAIHLARQARTGNLKTSSVPEEVEEDGKENESEKESESEGEGDNERTRLLQGHDQKPYRASDGPSSRDDPSHAFWDLPQVSHQCWELSSCRHKVL